MGKVTAHKEGKRKERLRGMAARVGKHVEACVEMHGGKQILGPGHTGHTASSCWLAVQPGCIALLNTDRGQTPCTTILLLLVVVAV